MRTLAPPVGRGWEYLHRHRLGLGRASSPRCPACWPRRSAAPSVEAGDYDLVIDPSNLWLTIHESIGHATELDRALGYEAAYAGTSFATFDKLGTLQYGSPVMHVTGDRTAEHGLSTVGFDDEGVQTQQWDLVTRRHPGRLPARPADGPAQGPERRPLQRLRLRRLPAARADPADGERLAAAGRRTARPPRSSSPASSAASTSSATSRWSIDMQRYNFQFTGQRVLPRSGTAGSPARSRTSPTRPRRPTSGARWRRSAARRPTCSAARSTAARASRGRSRRSRHGCPSALFRGIRILNTVAGGGQVTAGSPQQLVERALAAATGGRLRRPGRRVQRRQPALGQQHPDDQRRDHGRRLTVIATVDGGEGTAAGVVSRRRCAPDDLEELVRAAEARRPRRGAGRGRPAAAGRRAGARADCAGRAGARPTDRRSSPAFAPGARRGLRAGRARPGRLLFGFAEHELTSTYLGSSTGLRLRHDQPTGTLELNAKSADSSARLGRRRDPRLHRRGRRALARRARRSG